MATAFVRAAVGEKISASSGTRALHFGRKIAVNISNRLPERMGQQEFFPTILIATDIANSYPLLHSLKQDGYLVLQASAEAEALYVTISHSRPIRVLLVDDTPAGQELAASLKQYRQEMQVFFVPENVQRGCNALDTQIALAAIHEILPPPPHANADTIGTDVLCPSRPRHASLHLIP